jgi:hypothetical protein
MYISSINFTGHIFIRLCVIEKFHVHLQIVLWALLTIYGFL